MAHYFQRICGEVDETWTFLPSQRASVHGAVFQLRSVMMKTHGTSKSPEFWREKASLSPRAFYGLVGTQSTSEVVSRLFRHYGSRIVFSEQPVSLTNELYAKTYSVMKNRNCQPANYQESFWRMAHRLTQSADVSFARPSVCPEAMLR